MAAMIMVILEHDDRHTRPASHSGEPRRRAGHHHLGADVVHSSPRLSRPDHGWLSQLGRRSCSWVCVVGFVARRRFCGTPSPRGIGVLPLLQGVRSARRSPPSPVGEFLDINRAAAGQAMAFGAAVIDRAIIGRPSRLLTDHFNCAGSSTQRAGRLLAFAGVYMFMPDTIPGSAVRLLSVSLPVGSPSRIPV